MLLLVAQSAIAANPCVSNNVLICDEPYKKAPSILVDKVALGEPGVTFFHEIMTHTKLYELLVMLESSTPDITRTVEYLALFNETHQINQQLSALLIETKRTNRLLAAMSGAHSSAEGTSERLTNSE